MKIRYNVNVPEDYDFRGGKWSDLLKDFAQKNYRNQEIQFESANEAKQAAGGLRMEVSRKRYPFKVKKRGCSVYVERMQDESN